MPSKENAVHRVWISFHPQISHESPIGEATKAQRVLPTGQKRAQGRGRVQEP